MKKLALILSLAAFCSFSTASLFAQHKYVGVKICSMCHKTEKQGNQFGIWQASKHAEAFKTLQTDKANEIAKAKGLKTAAAESPECLKCHVTGYGSEAKMPTFKQEDGVQCEACHGPGSDYKVMSIMKDQKKAIAAGLVIAKDDPKLCTKCHNEESPTFKSFDYKVAWAKIKHPVPATK
ncbi:MAG: cytochrome c family protein [Bacteroidota bacterium]|nr:cytochrome c family protein [Bacteroidota bacterium]